MLRVCQTCGVIFDGDPAALKCPQCAEAAKRSVVRMRTCRTCGRTFPGGPRAWYCPQCREERQKAQSRAHKRHGPARLLGSTDYCTVCGKPYVVKSGRQKYCPACAHEAVRVIDRQQSLEWSQANTTPHDRKAARRSAAASLICTICGKTFAPDPNRANAKTCSPECAREARRRQIAQYGRDNRDAINDQKRERHQKKLAAMTPEELAAYREKINAAARRNYQKRKVRQS